MSQIAPESPHPDTDAVAGDVTGRQGGGFTWDPAQYESFALPFVIMLAVPVAILGALGFQLLRGLANDVFCQVGLLMLVGLSSKNAVLIVEFAEQLRAVHTKDPETRVVLKADRGVRYAEVRGVFKTLQEIGFPGISLQVVDLKKQE